jgi:antitoxin PrlF
MQLHYHSHLLQPRMPICMSAVLKVESTLTDRYQTTVPDAVRRALQLDKRDRLRYTVKANGVVHLSRLDTSEEDDPAIGAFLDFLARDITANPERLVAMPVALAKRMKKLTTGVKFDLTDALAPDAE